MRTLFAALLALALVACGGGREDRAVRVVTLWHSYADSERAALEALAAEWNATRPDVRLELVSVPHDAFPDKLTTAIPNGNGPDLFIFAHDRIGDWAEAGLLEPVEFWVDEALADHYDPQPLAAMAYRGSLYGLPLAVKCLALFWRTDMLDTPPATTDEMLAVGRRFTDRGAGRFGLVYENTKLYAHAPWLHGFGAAVFDEQGNLTLATPEAKAAMEFARLLGGPDGIVPSEVSFTLVGTLFNEGRAPMAVSGPWFVGQLDRRAKWAVAPLPTVSTTGKPAAPFLGAEGVLMSSRSKDKRAAFAVMAFLAGDGSAIARAQTAHQVVPNRAAYESREVSIDPVLEQFRTQAAVAVPMPSVPAMRMVWTPYDTALQKVVSQGMGALSALADAQREIEGYMQGAGHGR